MNVKIGKIASLILVSLLIMSFSMVGTAAADVHLLPLVQVDKTKLGTTGEVSVWLKGESDTDLDAYWDIVGFDINLHYNVEALNGIEIVLDPTHALGWNSIKQELDTIKGVARVAAMDLTPSAPPLGGKVILFSVMFDIINATKLPGLHVRNDEPRPTLLPTWDREYFMVDLAGQPHPERTDPPWNGLPWSPIIPCFVDPPLPVAQFTQTKTEAYKGDPIVFNASASYDPGSPHTIVGYAWDFESDGVIDDRGMVVSHSFALAGSYLVTLFVIDDDVYIGTNFGRVRIVNKPPVAAFSVSATSVYGPVPITFDASASYDLDGYIDVYYFSFGDGSGDLGKIVKHTYAAPGTYKPTVRVYDNEGAFKTSAAKTIKVTGPKAAFTVSTFTPAVDEVVTFDASASTKAGTLNYAWDFESDGLIDAYGVTASHAYGAIGFYKVTLTVSLIVAPTWQSTATAMLAVGDVLHKVWPEHRLYTVSKDEDAYNTLFAELKHRGKATADVKATFNIVDVRTGITVGPTLTATATVAPGEPVLQVNFKPADFEWDGTKQPYHVTVKLYVKDAGTGNWILFGIRPMLFVVEP